MRSPLETQHLAAGAKMGAWFGCPLPGAFTNVLEEYRFARDSVALLDANYHSFFYLSGPDRARYLNAVLTNNIRDLKPGEGNISLLLNPQGHIQAEIETYALPEQLLLLSHALVRERTFATLDKFIIMDDATLEDATDRCGSLAVEGPRADAFLRDSFRFDPAALTERGHAEVEIAGTLCRAIRRSLTGLPGVTLVAPRERLAVLWTELLEKVRAQCGGPAGYAAIDALRLEAGIPWFACDFDDKQIPHEAGLQNSHISYTKGCYTGQEIVERVRSRGHVNRIRVALRFSGDEAPPSGAPLIADGTEVGCVTSAAFSPGLGCAIGMASVRRERGSVGNKLECGGKLAEVVRFGR